MSKSSDDQEKKEEHDIPALLKEFEDVVADVRPYTVMKNAIIVASAEFDPAKEPKKFQEKFSDLIHEKLLGKKEDFDKLIESMPEDDMFNSRDTLKESKKAFDEELGKLSKAVSDGIKNKNLEKSPVLSRIYASFMKCFVKLFDCLKKRAIKKGQNQEAKQFNDVASHLQEFVDYNTKSSKAEKMMDAVVFASHEYFTQDMKKIIEEKNVLGATIVASKVKDNMDYFRQNVKEVSGVRGFLKWNNPLLDNSTYKDRLRGKKGKDGLQGKGR